MNKITTIGLDLAKNVFHAICCDSRGKVQHKKMLKRDQVLNYFATIPSALVGMEACASAHYWARELKKLGHVVKLIPPQYVKAFLRGNKNDYNDAQAIAEAVTRPEMRFVQIKTVEQQDMQAIHRLRERSQKMRVGLSNQLRGLLAEYGIVMPQGISTLRKRLPVLLEDGENGLSTDFRHLLAQGYQQLQVADRDMAFYDCELKRQSQQSEACQRLQTIPGYGPIVSSAFQSVIGTGEAFKRGRDVSASLGLVPRQHSSGGKDRLLGISKRGDRYLRGLLVHGGRAILLRAAGKDDRLSRWAEKIRQKHGFNKAVVALANKLARIGWAILAHKTVYQAIPSD